MSVPVPGEAEQGCSGELWIYKEKILRFAQDDKEKGLKALESGILPPRRPGSVFRRISDRPVSGTCGKRRRSRTKTAVSLSAVFAERGVRMHQAFLRLAKLPERRRLSAALRAAPDGLAIRRKTLTGPGESI